MNAWILLNLKSSYIHENSFVCGNENAEGFSLCDDMNDKNFLWRNRQLKSRILESFTPHGLVPFDDLAMEAAQDPWTRTPG
jgi:hypothetical protein